MTGHQLESRNYFSDDSEFIEGELSEMISRLKYGTEVECSTIYMAYERVLRIPDSNQNKARHLKKLGDLLGEPPPTCQCPQQIVHLDHAISAYEKAANLLPDSDPDKPKEYLLELATLLLTRLTIFGWYLDVIEKGIRVYEDIIRLVPDGQHEKSSYLHDLGHLYSARFKQLHDISDLDKCISADEDAIRLMCGDDLQSDSLADRVLCLRTLAISLFLRGERLNNLSDIDKCISIIQTVIQLTPEPDPQRVHYLALLGQSLSVRFGQLQDLTDLNIAAYKDAIQLLPDDHPDRQACLHAIFEQCLFSRVTRLGDLSDMNRAISVNQDLVRLTPDDNTHKAEYLTNLAQCFRYRFERLGVLSDIENSILMEEKALQFLSDDDLEKIGCLRSLADSLDRRFERLGDVSDLNKAVLWRETVLRLISDDHPDRVKDMDNFATALAARYERLGDVDDINRAVLIGGEAVHLAADGDPSTLLCLHNFGHTLLLRFRSLGDLDDLKKSMSMFGDAVQQAPDTHPLKGRCLDGLGESLVHRFKRYGDVSDISAAVNIREAAVQLIPDTHPDKPLYLDNLGGTFLTRFERLGDISDINKAILFRENAVQLTPDNHIRKVKCVNNLANVFHTRFNCLNDFSDVEKLVLLREKAVMLSSDTDPFKPFCLDGLGVALLCRFQSLGQVHDIDAAISASETAIQLIPDGHPEKPACLINLALSLEVRFGVQADRRDLDMAILHSSSAARSSIAAPSTRFSASEMWAAEVRANSGTSSSIEAYSVALSLIPELAWLGSAITDRHRQIMNAGNIVRDAASAAIELNKFDTAVEWLEQGRSVIWNQLLQLRTPVDDLKERYPELAARLTYLSKMLESAGTRETSLDGSAIGSLKSLESVGQYHNFARERDELLKQIRTLKGFDRFLLPKPVSQLFAAADGGPVVLLNGSVYGCHALILNPANPSDIMHVSLNNFTFGDAQALRRSLRNLLTYYGRGPTFEPGSRLKALRVPDDERLVDPEAEFSRIFSQLWIQIARPILDALKITTPMPTNGIRRIWWCPTGPLAFLPIHAAGLYGQDHSVGSRLSDFVVSSYTPTLTALINGSAPGRPRKEQILTVALPSESRLPGALEELKHVEEHAVSLRVLQLLETKATIESVSNGMHESSWVHFACHGEQDMRNPTESALLLSGHSKLTLSKIIKLSLPHADFAFLSACQTATGDEDLAEESVHLAAGMLLAGYRSVIATMWSIVDNDAPRVAEDVYSHLFKGGNADSSRAAEALHLAVRRLCDEGKPFISWVPFIHIGV